MAGGHTLSQKRTDEGDSLSFISLSCCLPDVPPLLFLGFFSCLTFSPSSLSGGYNGKKITRAALSPDQWPPVESTGVLSATLILWHQCAPLSVCRSLSHTGEPMGNRKGKSSNPQRLLERLTAVGWKSMFAWLCPKGWAAANAKTVSLNLEEKSRMNKRRNASWVG